MHSRSFIFYNIALELVIVTCTNPNTKTRPHFSSDALLAMSHATTYFVLPKAYFSHYSSSFITFLPILFHFYHSNSSGVRRAVKSKFRCEIELALYCAVQHSPVIPSFLPSFCNYVSFRVMHTIMLSLSASPSTDTPLVVHPVFYFTPTLYCTVQRPHQR